MSREKQWEELVNWEKQRINLDSESYFEALKSYMPAHGEKFLFLWNRAQDERAIREDDHYWFGNKTMLVLAPHVEVGDAKKLLNEIVKFPSDPPIIYAEAISILCQYRIYDDGRGFEKGEQEKYWETVWNLIYPSHSSNEDGINRITDNFSEDFNLEKWLQIFNNDKFREKEFMKWLRLIDMLSSKISGGEKREAMVRIVRLNDFHYSEDRKAKTIANLCDTDRNWNEIFWVMIKNDESGWDDFLQRGEKIDMSNIYSDPFFIAVELMHYIPNELKPGNYSIILKELLRRK